MTIIGYKGGKGGSAASTSSATEDPDSLRSRAYARVIDLICEGEIEGLATGDLQSVYLDETPIMNADGTMNFSGVTVATRNGTQSQTYIPGFPSVESEVSVNTQVKQGIPVVRTITDSVYTHARVTIGIPQLSNTSTASGDISGTSVSYRILVQPSSGSYTEVVSQRITGKTTTRYQKSHLIKLTGSAPWNIKVERLTDDSTTQYLLNTTYWDTMTQVVDAKLAYPNSALVAMVIDSSQFSSIPTRAFDMKMLRTQIPTNATVNSDGSLSYSGTWDGTFKIAWHSNPAWCYYDMMTTDRYGLGQYIDAAQIDKWTLYTIGQYCDQQVPNGYGGYEPRFSCNLYLQTQNEAFTVMRDMAAIFRGMTYWTSGLITAVQDSPSDPVALFTNSNVVDGLFTYSGTSLKTRHSVALVQWNDPSAFYKQRVEYVEDSAAVSRYGLVTTSIAAMGCTSRAQAHRVGKWLLYSEAFETETVTFKAGLDSTLVRPGQVINVHDRDRAGVRLGGRIASATYSSVVVDSAVTPSSGATYTLYVIMPDGTVASSAVASFAGTTINVVTPFTAVPSTNAVWALSATNAAIQQFRVVGVTENDDGTFDITGTAYNQAKYSAVEQNITLTQSPVSTLTGQPDAPQNVAISESLYETNTDVATLVTISWDAVAGAQSYALTYQRDDGQAVTVSGITGTFYDLRNAAAGNYSASVVAVSVLNKRSVSGTASATVFGKTALPTDVQNFSLAGVSDGVAHLVWDAATDLDVRVGGSVRIRYTPNTSTPSWANSVDIGTALSGTATSASVPHIDGTYLAKFIDSSGNASANAVQVTTTAASLLNTNVINTVTESPAWAGTKTGCLFSSAFGGLISSGGTLIDNWADIDSWVDWDLSGGLTASATYDFANYVDLGAVFNTLLTATISAQGIDISSLIDSRTASIDDWTALDGTAIDDVNAALWVRTTNDNPAGTPTWSSWRQFFVGQYAARAFQFQLRLTSNADTHSIMVTGLSVDFDMADRTEAGGNVSSGAASYSVVFANGFWGTPAIGITMQNAASGDYYTLSAVSNLGFTITFKNSAGTTISRVFDWMAKGQGYKH